MAKVKDNKENKETKESLNKELLENPELMVSKTEDFFTKNKVLIYTVLGVMVLAIAAFSAYRYITSSQQEEALGEMYPAEFYLEADSINKMLNGDGNYLGVQQIAEEYNWSKAGNLAHLYAAIGLMKQEKFEEALKNLDEFSSGDVIVQGRAYALKGDAYVELKQYDKATNAYKQAVDHHPNKFFTPLYLMKLALAYELKESYKEAIDIYDELIYKYPTSQEVNNAKKYKARAEQLTTKTGKQ
ncbi:MAG: tol-pal system YbgF family protein [Thermonemataceae bacterium]